MLLTHDHYNAMFNGLSRAQKLFQLAGGKHYW
jgi:hypothetical protein